eukprot:GHVU01178242.1.p1 GENE.GHVU01178242.1~~GHVU01178242.1.p1  ORF type:complete len:143 (-),score=4.33 GHVU01178242.1:101-529(-)
MSPGTPTANTHQHDTYHNLSLSRTPAVGGGLTSVRCNGVGCDVNVTRRHRSGTHYLIHFWDGKKPRSLRSHLKTGDSLRIAAFKSVKECMSTMKGRDDQSHLEWRIFRKTDKYGIMEEVGDEATVMETGKDTPLLLLRGHGK